MLRADPVPGQIPARRDAQRRGRRVCRDVRLPAGSGTPT